MSLFSPPPKKQGEAPSPTRKPDGISLDGQHLPRDNAVQDIYDKAKRNHFVVLGSPPSTGKTSLLQLLKSRLENEKGAKVINYPIRPTSSDVLTLVKELAEKGITSDQKELNQLQNTWLLIDDAQNAYAKHYNKFWEIVVKDGSASDSKGLFVVIAATYDLTTYTSPVNFKILQHVDPNICRSEGENLMQMHLDHWRHPFSGWVGLRDQVLALSELAVEDDRYHIGVIMAAIRCVDEKIARRKDLSENEALDLLRGPTFTTLLDRCYAFDGEDVSSDMKKYLQMALVSKPGLEDFTRSAIGPLLRAGIINADGKFSCLAANWYYNRHCFPKRPLDAPANLRQLIIDSIGCMSAKRLCDAVQSGFPKEAAFQQLMNEAMASNLPARHVIIPEYNTKAFDSQDPSADAVTGELDFYVNGDKQWCIEMLREGKGIGEHLQRFKITRDRYGNKGKYRKVQTKEYYVIDCRGPKLAQGAKIDDNKCTLYFEEDFSKCVCEMKGEQDETIFLKE